jgi:nuclear mRNA export protein SAC3
MLCDNPSFSEQQEMEQLRKVLQSLMEFYKDTKMSPSPLPLPNEIEFRSYYALVFLRDQDVTQQLQTLPGDILFSPRLGRSLRLRALAQRSSDRFIQYNAEAAPNSFARFFKEVHELATYLEACILETWFGSIRTGAFKALRQALGVKALQVAQVSVTILSSMLGFDDVGQLVAFCDYINLEIVSNEDGSPKAVWFKRSAPWEGTILIGLCVGINF